VINARQHSATQRLNDDSIVIHGVTVAASQHAFAASIDEMGIGAFLRIFFSRSPARKL
jgi:hypothetical protein